jgi:hypothetical protein
MGKSKNVRYDPPVARRGTTFCIRMTRTLVPGSKRSEREGAPEDD